LASCLPFNTALKHLNLEHNAISESGGTKLEAAVHCNNHLRACYLEGNDVGEEVRSLQLKNGILTLINADSTLSNALLTLINAIQVLFSIAQKLGRAMKKIQAVGAMAAAGRRRRRNSIDNALLSPSPERPERKLSPLKEDSATAKASSQNHHQPRQLKEQPTNHRRGSSPEKRRRKQQQAVEAMEDERDMPAFRPLSLDGPSQVLALLD